MDWSMIGDLLMLSPAVRTIRARYPEAHLALLGQPGSIATYKHHPGVNELIPYDRSRGDWNFASFRQTLAQVRAGRFDLAFVFHNSIGSALMAWLGGVRERVGYNWEGRGIFLTSAIPVPKEREHLIATKLRLLAAYGLEVEDAAEEVFIDEAAAAVWTKDKLGPNFGRSRPIVSIAIGATRSYKQWSTAELNRLLKLLPVNSCDIVFVGSPQERGLFSGVYSYNNTVVDLVGETTIEELTWVLDRADLHIGPDSGPMHLAIARQTPVVALFGGTDPVRCGPYKYAASRVVRAHSVCRDCERAHGRHIAACTHTIAAEDVYAAAQELLAEYAPLWKG